MKRETSLLMIPILCPKIVFILNFNKVKGQAITYSLMSQVSFTGKVIKKIFLCKYSASITHL